MEAREFLKRRLEAATTILETLQKQERLLQQLTQVTQKQKGIAFHLRALSVLINVEVARLGNAGGNFQLLAQESTTFSKSLSQQSLELAADTESRQRTIAETRGGLAANLASLRSEVAGMEEDIAKTLRVIDAGLSHQITIPRQFRRCMEETSQQIVGVVAAIQAQDITRQQTEHVRQGLQLIASRVAAATRGDDLSEVYAALNIQSCQLKSIQETVGSWTSQMRRCLQGIAQLSASEVAGIGPTVLEQERELSLQLSQIELLQEKSQDYSEQMQRTLGGLSNLAELIHSHLERSQAIRDRLEILMFNSLIEAERLGQRGAVVSAIANLIKGVSAEWNSLGERSRLALSELLELGEQTTGLMEVFSEASRQKLRQDQAQTRNTLDKLREEAALVAKEAAQIETVMERMQAKLAAAGDAGDRLQACFGQFEPALSEIEYLARALEENDTRMPRCDMAEVEGWFSTLYTTEMERDVMRAALGGASLPVAAQSFAGNAVELF